MSFQISNYKWENQKQTGDVWGAEWGGDRWQDEILLKQKADICSWRYFHALHHHEGMWNEYPFHDFR